MHVLGYLNSMTYYIEKWENLPITNDYIFCKVFEDAELCKDTFSQPPVA